MGFGEDKSSPKSFYRAAKIVSIEVPTLLTVNPWIKFSGIYQDDPDFAEIAAAMRAERNPSEDNS
jgi:hypothetical protein